MTALPDDLIPPFLAIEGDEPFPVQLLDRLPDTEPEDGQPDVPELAAIRAWKISDDGAAEWAMAHLAQIRANLDAVAAQRAAYVERIDHWHRQMSNRLGNRAAFFEQHLIAYAEAFRARDPKHNKTLHLPSGRVSSTESQPAVIVADDEAVAAWAAVNLDGEQWDATVNVTTKVLVKELRKYTQVGVRVVSYGLALDCGHVTETLPADDAGEAVDLSGDWPCPFCDPIDGAPLRKIVTVEDRQALVVRDRSGEIVPGADVRPGGVSFDVKPS